MTEASQVDVAELRAMLATEARAMRMMADCKGKVPESLLDAWLKAAGALNEPLRKAAPALLNAWEERERLREALQTICDTDLSSKPTPELLYDARVIARTALQGGE